MIRTCLFGGDNIGWALDMELSLTRLCLPPWIQISNFLQNDVLHLVRWNSLINTPRELLVGRRVMSHLTHAPETAFAEAEFSHVGKIVQLWVVRSTQAHQTFSARGLRTVHIPYAYDPAIFFPIPKDDPRLQSLRDEWKVPSDAFLVGSFQRDTEGSDLISPKLIKGPDIFLECVLLLREHMPNLHVVLAGPRRFWLRQKLAECGIPHTFIGKDVHGDDIKFNVVSQQTINLLYNLVHVYLVTSRMEGGPQAILEASATGCKILSTAVGHVEDFLHKDCIFHSPQDVVEKICADDLLANTVSYNAKSVERATPKALLPLWDDAYRILIGFPALTGKDVVLQSHAWQVVLDRLKSRK
jgi:glycosyltransferase involved in cell wall biosynthesis